MNDQVETQDQGLQVPSGTTSAVLKNDIQLGKMSLIDLMRHIQNLESLGEIRAAVNLCALWINFAPANDKHYALFNYGGLLQGLGQFEEAQKAYESCMAMREDFPQAYINLGLMFEKRGHSLQALNTWLLLISRRFLNQPPPTEFLTMALNHVGRVQEILKNYAQAEEALEQSLLLDPKQPGVIQHWIHIRQKACQWPVYKSLPGIRLAELRRCTSPLAMLALTEDPAEQLSISQAFVARTYGFKEEHLFHGHSWKHNKIRVGYVSADFREHAVGFLLAPFLKGHSRDAYELYAYDYSREEATAVRAHLKNQFSHFQSIEKLSDRQAAELILHDEIDILIDLHGLSSGARPGIFALHPSPRQGTYLGFIGPTGMPWFDFVIADENVLPVELANFFSEKPVYVEGSFLPMISNADKDLQVTRKEIGLPQDAFVMAALGNSYKITPEMFGAWMRLLQRIPNALLWLIDDNEVGTRNLRAQAVQMGISEERLFFMGRTTHVQFCARLKLADIYLDTYPYNCGSTSNDVISAGVPLVTRYGKTMVSRMGLSILTSLNGSEMACRTLPEYEDKVLELYLKNKAGVVPAGYRADDPINLDNVLRLIFSNLVIAESIPKLVANTKLKLCLYQICYSAETRRNIPAQFMALENLENNRPDWREYWPIRNFLLNHVLEDNAFYGFLSPRFTYKTGLDFEKIRNFAQQNGNENDVLIFSPFWDLNSFFLNSFVQGEYFHPGLMNLMQKFSDSVGLDLDLSQTVTHTDNTAYCNYFIAKKKFWLHWLELGEKLFQISELGTADIAKTFNENTPYSEEQLPIKIFIQERLVNLILAKSNFKSKAFNVFEMPGSVTPLNNFLQQAIVANALKFASSKMGEREYLDVYWQNREQVWRQSGMDKLTAR
jgi:predicted O-linked N-acetylglucosamine transferase (SPINDLY family)